ncbi:hypothetical protein EON63_18995 [archaeon]|nr:MAG: hypothetical protein EON63_18995 [archaeon]
MSIYPYTYPYPTMHIHSLPHYVCGLSRRERGGGSKPRPHWTQGRVYRYIHTHHMRVNTPYTLHYIRTHITCFPKIYIMQL